MRKCYVCEAIKPNEEYYSFSGSSETSRRMNICKSCQRAKQKEYRLAHPEIVKAQKKIWYDGARSELIDKRRQVMYGMEKGEYDRRLAEQEGKCFLCGTESQDCPKGTLNVDHNHETGEVRALLCSHCNLGLGSLRDDPDLLDKAAAYLRIFNGNGSLEKTG